MKCLNCPNEFETENKRKVFCSGKCKVAYHRTHKKKSEVTKFDLKVLYNEILALAQNISAAPQPKVYDAPKITYPVHDEPKQWQAPEVSDNLQKWKNEMNDCDSLQELDYIGQRISNSGLTRLEQNILTKYGKMICEKKGFI